MPGMKDRTGQRYGRLVALSPAGHNKAGRLLWRCKCDCGNEKIVTSNDLSSKRSNSCGCLRDEVLRRKQNIRIEDRETAIIKVQYSYIKKRNINFTGDVLPFDEFFEKVRLPCIYCGMEYSKTLEDRRNDSKKCGLISDTVIKINGLDRIDSNVGYTSENTVPCCKYCNTAKNTMTQQEFKSWLIHAYNHYVKK